MWWCCWECVCALEVSGQHWKVRLCISTPDDLGESETTQVLLMCECVCVYGMCESQRGRASETEQAVFRECIGDIKVLLFSSTKTLFIHFLFCDLLSLSHWSRSKQADKKAPAVCQASFKSVNHRRPLSPFWQISSSSSIGCGILLSVSFWHWEGREGRTWVPCWCNYITASLASAIATDPIIPWKHQFYCVVGENAIFESQQERGWGLRMCDACVGECIMSQEWLWQTDGGILGQAVHFHG